MTTNRNLRRGLQSRAAGLGLGLLLGLMAISRLPAAVLPPDAIVGGRTIGEWSAECWTWIYSIPTNQNPQLDCGSGQWAAHRQPDSQVFMVAPVNGTSDGTCERTFEVPAGRHILVPLIVLTIDNINVPPPLPTIPEMIATIESVTRPARSLHATIDGVPVPNLDQHYALSPPFAFDFPDADNTLSLYYQQDIVGLLDPVISSGYWLMIEPLPPGEHVLHVGGSLLVDWVRPHDILCRITVVENHPPVADASATVSRVIATSPTGASVVLDGSRSSDPDHDALTYRWSEGPNVLGVGERVTVLLGVGRHVVQLAVNDSAAQATTEWTIDVMTPEQVLSGLRQSFASASLQRGDRATLVALTGAAQQALARHRLERAVLQLHVLDRFILRRIKPLDPALATEWRGIISDLIAALAVDGHPAP